MGVEEPIKVLYDFKLLRPGCVLLQALTGDPRVAHEFPSETWLVAPSEDMKVYRINQQQLKQLVELTQEAHAARKQKERAK